MQRSIKVSVIVPIYNVEKYLKKCLDSLAAQDMQDIEFILIDDGSTDSCPRICDEYAARDSRFHVVHKENAGVGIANNTGLDMARGEYIGFVESDDWIEPDMYSSLYAVAQRTGVDVVKGFYTEHYSNRKINRVNPFQNNPNVDRIVRDMSLIPEFLLGYISHWSAIYKATMLKDNNIRFNETPGAAFQDTGFIAQVFAVMTSCYILSKYVHHYSKENPNASTSLNVSEAKMYKNAGVLLKEFSFAYDRVCAKDATPFVRNIFMRRFVEHMCHYYNCFGMRRKMRFVYRLSPIFAKHIDGIDYQYFNSTEKRRFKSIARHPLLVCLSILIVHTQMYDEGKNTYILGYPVKKVSSVDRTIKRKYLGGLFYTKIGPDYKKLWVLGLPILTRHQKKSKGVQIEADIRRSVYLNELNQAAAVMHPAVFGKYKNAFAGRDVVLVACGPSAKYFKHISDAVYVGVKRAYKAGFPLDYLFVTDWREFYDMDDIQTLSHRPELFYGIVPPNVLRDPDRSILVPESVAIRHGANRFYIKDEADKNIPDYAKTMTYDIAALPLTCIASGVIVAMQFILYGNPRCIYLVGCDCSTGYFFDSDVQPRPSDLMVGAWQQVKDFAADWYPETEIISVNPVGLRGMFRDVYTREYLAKHPEIDAGSVEILENEVM